MPDPYKSLGVDKTASQDDIKKAYRALAKKYHPDLNPGRPEIEAKFKDVTAAYDVLSDPKTRARFDRGEIDADGNERAPFGGGFGADFGEAQARAQRAYRGFKPGAGARGFGFSGKAGGPGKGFRFGAEELFAELFGDEDTRGGSARVKGNDIRMAVTVPLPDAVRGGKRRVNLPDGRALQITIPPGTEDGQTLRLKGQGLAGLGDAPRGDALFTVKVPRHPLFRREGHDIHVELPISLREAVLGGKVEVPTIDGAVSMTVKPNTNGGTLLRLKGKGVAKTKKPDGARGDQFVTLRITLPDKADPDLKAFVERWPAGKRDVREKMREG